MGAVPKSKVGPRRKRLRRTHYKAALVQLAPCERCGQLHRPHHICPNCGSYRGVEVMKVGDDES